MFCPLSQGRSAGAELDKARLSLSLSHLICVSWRVLSIKTIYCKLVVNNVKWSFSEHKTPPVRPAPHTAK